MSTFSKLFFSVALATCATSAYAQGPGGQRGQRGQGGRDGGSFIDRIMENDANGDGKITVDELKDERMKAMFARIDSDQDGVVTKEDLTKMVAERGEGGRRGPGGAEGGRGGRGEGGGRGGEGGERGGRGGDRGPGGARQGGGQPGQIISVFMQERLGLNDEQKAAITELQAQVDAQLAMILTADQQAQLKQGPPQERGGRGGEEGGEPRERGGNRGRPEGR
ncbi:EF hand [Neorhodopirellula lusitana]|uniref:EF hand n=1 Tax=Neorhodopirellula lusitana TaxID=445327 RepID=A0ABY1QNJ9_9BACT|nr:EF-hand domain-containing protein [Neorhodopirellula lusitana]SMP73305.1 EF hand [Neorhodopirellula lusitana]